MRRPILALLCLSVAPFSYATGQDGPSLGMSLGGFSGDETTGLALGFYVLRPDKLGWYVNGTVSSLVDDDDDFRPIPDDIRVDRDTDSVTLNVGVTLSLGRLVPYLAAGVRRVGEYGLYRTPNFSY